jgi:ribonuclease E
MKRVLVSGANEEQAVVVVSDNGVEDIFTGASDDARLLGNIYKGQVVNVEGRLQAAFVDFGEGWEGFLHVSNLHEAYGEKGAHEDGIQAQLSAGQEVLVQIQRDKRRPNDFALTTHLSLPGRYLVLMPGSDKRGVSKKIVDVEERKRLRQVLKDLAPPETLGYVIRTDSIDASAEDIGYDLQYLLGEWRRMAGRIGQGSSPSLVYEDADFVFQTLKNCLDGIDEVIFDSPLVYERAKHFLPVLVRGYRGGLKLHRGETPLLAAHGVDSVRA